LRSDAKGYGGKIH